MYILVFRKQGPDGGEAERALDSLVAWRKLHGAADLGGENGCEYTDRIRLGSAVTPETLLGRLKAIKDLYDSSSIIPTSQIAIRRLPKGEL